MPKLKTKRGAAKRLRVTGSGKVKHYKSYASHLLTAKTTKRKRTLRKSELVSDSDLKNVKRLIPFL
jgi:large subunit ribosomal protein L35